MSDLKARAKDAVDKSSNDLLELSHSLHENPETMYKEFKSAKLVAGVLRNAGFDVEEGVAGLETAFIASFGSGPLNIGICAEYDALPVVGHACGHNIIAAAAVGAGIALKELANELNISVVVLGTPAEEGGGGKTYMLQRGAFDGLNAAMMVHAGPYERDAMGSLALSGFHFEFKGKAAHAAAAPHRGKNAASALALAQMGINAFREHLTERDRIHGIVTHGGDATNVIPERATGTWYTRATTIERERMLSDRLVKIFEGAALMTDTALTKERAQLAYADIRTDADMASLWRDNAKALGRESLPIQPTDGFASTDMGNVSYAMPSIHPVIAIEANGATIHEAEFAKYAREATGDKAVVDGAIAMAWTAIDMATNDKLRARLEQRTYAVANEDRSAPYLSFS